MRGREGEGRTFLKTFRTIQKFCADQKIGQNVEQRGVQIHYASRLNLMISLKSVCVKIFKNDRYCAGKSSFRIGCIV
jgi:hypothetical protein